MAHSMVWLEKLAMKLDGGQLIPISRDNKLFHSFLL